MTLFTLIHHIWRNSSLCKFVVSILWGCCFLTFKDTEIFQEFCKISALATKRSLYTTQACGKWAWRRVETLWSWQKLVRIFIQIINKSFVKIIVNRFFLLVISFFDGNPTVNGQRSFGKLGQIQWNLLPLSIRLSCWIWRNSFLIRPFVCLWSSYFVFVKRYRSLLLSSYI